MKTTATVIFSGSSYSFEFNEITICPICNHAIKPVQLYGTVYKKDDDTFNSSFLYLCKSCNDTFIVQYDNVYRTSSNGGFFEDIKCVPKISPIKFTVHNFDELISSTSPTFVKIYNQAFSAETQGLDEIAGIGYRKALEFLIKDFIISTNPDKKEQIEKSALGQCVTTYIDNPQLKIAASRAVWLGNDQTHYIQKFEDKDIDDLKRLIRLTVHWISMILETEVAATIEHKK